MKKNHCLLIEVKGCPDCGYIVAFETPPLCDFSSPAFAQWREAVTQAVFVAGSEVFSPARDHAVENLLRAFERINARHAPKIKSCKDVPALQIESVDGKRYEIEFSGRFDATVKTAFSRKTLAVSRTINGHGAGGIRAAEKTDFPFAGVIRPESRSKGPRGPKPG